MLLRFRAGADVDAQIERLSALGIEYVESRSSAAVEGLGNIRTLPIALALFFALSPWRRLLTPS